MSKKTRTLSCIDGPLEGSEVVLRLGESRVALPIYRDRRIDGSVKRIVERYEHYELRPQTTGDVLFWRGSSETEDGTPLVRAF